MFGCRGFTIVCNGIKISASRVLARYISPVEHRKLVRLIGYTEKSTFVITMI